MRVPKEVSGPENFPEKSAVDLGIEADHAHRIAIWKHDPIVALQRGLANKDNLSAFATIFQGEVGHRIVFDLEMENLREEIAWLKDNYTILQTAVASLINQNVKKELKEKNG